MSVSAWLLWALFHTIVAGPVQRATWSEGGNSPLTEEDGARLRPSFFHLPMFHHAPAPLVAPEHFRPVRHKRPFPAELAELLFPPTRRPQSVQEPGARAVEVWCGVDKVSVRVDRWQLRTWTAPSLFRLGSCRASRVSARFLHFHYGLTECDGEAQVIGGLLVYTYLLSYTPPRQDFVLRAVPLNFPIQCQYNRFYYSYQVGFRPQVQHTTFIKSLQTKLSFSLTVCNAQWEPLPPGHRFSLGEQVYFVAQTGALMAGERLYVDSCHATSSKDPNSKPRLDIVSNYGCMMDSRREGSGSQFLQREASVLKFSVDAFLFKAVSQMLYLHCSMSVGLATSLTSKSCNYNTAATRWQELEALHSVCSCCDSVCTDTHNHIESTVSSPAWHIGQKGEDKPRMEIFQAEEDRDWLKSEGRMGERLRKVQTFQIKTDINHEEEKEEILHEISLLPDETIEWRHSTAVRPWGGKEEKESETEEVAAGELKELMSDGNIMSDQSRPQEKKKHQARDDDDDLGTRDDSVSDLSSNHSSSDLSRVGFDTTTVTRISSFGIDHDNISNHGFDDGISSAVISIANDGLFDDGLETLARTLPATSNLDFDLPGFDKVRKLGKSRLNLNSFLMSEQPVNESGNTKSDGIQQRAVDSVGSKGADEDEDMLHGLQIRALESDQSARSPGLRGPSCVDGLLCESDFDSEIEEGKALHLSQFTRVAKTSRDVQDLSGAIPRTGVNSGSASLEQMHQDSPSYSAVVAVSTLRSSESHQMTDGEWAEAVPHWGLQSFRFVAKQPTESFEEGDGYR